MTEITGTTDPDILGVLPALKRAARRALKEGLETGTPVWVIKDGKMVDLTRERPKRRNNTRRR
jgi:hypothetical protein